mgnify:CR=1 FL=1
MDAPHPLDSPYARQLGTNYVPSDQDVAHIRHLIAKPQAHVDNVDKEIARLTEMLAALQRERQSYQSYINQHRAILSPIRRVPPEILQCIFLRCLPTKHNSVMSSLQAPILLTHVCRDWRAAALKMPRLWASLHIPIPHRPQKPFPPYPTPAAIPLSEEEGQVYIKSVQRWEEKMQERKEIVQTWLSRAAGCKLSISITLLEGRTQSSGEDFNHDVIKAILDTVISASHQWRRIEILASPTHISELLALPMHAVPYLEQVKVTCNPFSSSPFAASPPRYLPVPPNGLLAAPRLSSFHFKLIPESPLSLPVNWSQLTELYFDGAASRNFEGGTLEFSPRDARELLRSCPLLIRCRLVVVQSMFTPTAAPTAFIDDEDLSPIPLHNLEALSIHEGAPLESLFAQIEAPRLEEVVFTSSMPPYEGELTSLVTLLKHAGPTVRRLTFDYPCLTTEDIQRSLALVPNLTHLSISSNPRVRSFVIHQYDAHRVPASARFTNAMLALLTPRMVLDEQTGRAVVQTLCPNLTTLSCKYLSPEFTEDALLDFIRSRRGEGAYRYGVASLRKVHVCFKRPMQGVDVVKELEKEQVDTRGLRIAVSYTPPMQKGVESFSPSLGITQESLVPYLC